MFGTSERGIGSSVAWTGPAEFIVMSKVSVWAGVLSERLILYTGHLIYVLVQQAWMSHWKQPVLSAGFIFSWKLLICLVNELTSQLLWCLLCFLKKKKSKPRQWFIRTSQLTDNTLMLLLPPSLPHVPADFDFLFFSFPFVKCQEAQRWSHGALSSSADHRRLLPPFSLPLTYWYSVTFEFHNCSPTFITAHFRQRCHEALQRLLRRVSVNDSRCCLQEAVQRSAQTQ